VDTNLFQHHRHKYVVPKGDEGVYVLDEAIELAKVIGRIELYLPLTCTTVLVDPNSDLDELVDALAESSGNKTVGPCILDAHSNAKLIALWLSKNPPEEEVAPLWEALPDRAREALIAGVCEQLIAQQVRS